VRWDGCCPHFVDLCYFACIDVGLWIWTTCSGRCCNGASRLAATPANKAASAATEIATAARARRADSQGSETKRLRLSIKPVPREHPGEYAVAVRFMCPVYHQFILHFAVVCSIRSSLLSYYFAVSVTLQMLEFPNVDIYSCESYGTTNLGPLRHAWWSGSALYNSVHVSISR